MTTGQPRPARARVGDESVRYRVLSVRAIAAWAVLIVLVGVGVAGWLLLAYTGGDAEANRAQLDAIRTAGTVVVGTGGAAALLLAARRQRSTEIQLRQNDRVAEQTEADAAARRITELYGKAVEQLGSDKAAVRLGGLYALERLAQDTPSQRQTIVNVLCAYLRMPFTTPPTPRHRPLGIHRARSRAGHRQATPHQPPSVPRAGADPAGPQEREVRLAAQRILVAHLRPGVDQANPVDTFWADIDLDLTNATLIDLHLSGCRLRTAIFIRAHFIGDAWFNGAQFDTNVSFGGARFGGLALFGDARFGGDAWFREAEFDDLAVFLEAHFGGTAVFDEARFGGTAWFSGGRFGGAVAFDETRFGGDAWFGEAHFGGEVSFREAWFDGDVSLTETTFSTEVPGEVARFVSSTGE